MFEINYSHPLFGKLLTILLSLSLWNHIPYVAAQQVTYNSVTWAGTGTSAVSNGFRTSASFKDPVGIA